MKYLGTVKWNFMVMKNDDIYLNVNIFLCEYAIYYFNQKILPVSEYHFIFFKKLRIIKLNFFFDMYLIWYINANVIGNLIALFINLHLKNLHFYISYQILVTNLSFLMNRDCRHLLSISRLITKICVQKSFMEVLHPLNSVDQYLYVVLSQLSYL